MPYMCYKECKKMGKEKSQKTETNFNTLEIKTMMIQGSDEWKQARVGKVTASRMADVMARTKSGYGASRSNYMAELIAERLTGNPANGYVNEAMKFGTENEPLARAAYVFSYGVEVEEVGFIDHPEMEMTGCSPDGLIGKDGLIEIKVPNTSTHIDFLLGEEIPDKYIKQMDWQMECTGRQWVDFASFDPRLPEHLRLKIIRVHRNESRLSIMRVEVLKFIVEMNAMLEKLSRLAA